MITPAYSPTATERVLPRMALDFTTGVLDPRVTVTRASTATFVGSNGLIQTAAINAPRFDYNPVTLAPKGLLIEEARTNLIVYSAQYDDPTWGKFGSTITPNTTVSPDGTTTADTQTATATSGVYVQLAVGTLTNGQNYTVTRYVKAGTKAFCTIGMFGLADAYFDLANLTTSFAGTGAVSASITDAGNGWRRVSATWTWGAGTTYRLFFAMASSLSSQSGITVGDTLFLWGAQLEAGAFATSYIPTVASQVTRNADNVSMTGTNFSSWYNGTAGTFAVTADSATVASTGFMLTADDGTGNNRFGFYRSGTACAGYIVTGGVTQIELTKTAVAANTFFNAILAATANNGNFAFNSSLSTADTSITMPTLTRLSIGGSAGSTAWFGHIAKISYWPQRLLNAELQAFSK